MFMARPAIGPGLWLWILCKKGHVMHVLFSLASHLTTSGFNGNGMQAGLFDVLFGLLGSLFELLFESIFDSIFLFLQFLIGFLF